MLCHSLWWLFGNSWHLGAQSTQMNVKGKSVFHLDLNPILPFTSYVTLGKCGGLKFKCPPKICIYLELQNVTVFGNRVFPDTIS